MSSTNRALFFGCLASVGVAVALVGWLSYKKYQAMRAGMVEKAIADLLAQAEASGHMGRIEHNDFQCGVPFYRRGDQLVQVVMAGYPGKPRGPALLLVWRLNPKAAFSLGSGMIVDGDGMSISPSQYDSLEKPFGLDYRVPRASPKESFAAGGQAYDLAAGRVFVVDLTAQPVQVSQIPVSLEELLPNTASEPSAEELKAAVEKLTGKHPRVRSFSDERRP